MLARTLQIVLLPFVVIGGFFVVADVGGFVEDFWDDFLVSFLIMYWIGLGFANMWDVVRDSVKGARPGVVAASVGVVLVVLVVAVGPVSLVDDPWLFGVLVAPGIELAVPYLRGQRTMGASDASPPTENQ